MRGKRALAEGSFILNTWKLHGHVVFSPLQSGAMKRSSHAGGEQPSNIATRMESQAACCEADCNSQQMRADISLSEVISMASVWL